MQRLGVSGAVRHIYIYIIRWLKVNGSHPVVFNLLKVCIPSKHNKLLSINDYKC